MIPSLFNNHRKNTQIMILSVNEKNFSQEVLNSSQLVIVDFWAPWCGLCKAIVPILLKLQSESTQPIKLVSINADDNLKLANTYRLKSLPTLLVFERGVIIQRFENFHSRDGLYQVLSEIVLTSVAQSV
jgi:thioredoxin 1